MGVGLTLPVWQNYLMKLFSEEKVFSAMAIILFIQSAARLLSSFVILGVVKKYSMDPKTSAVIFIIVGAVFCIGTAFYLLTKEVNTEIAGTPRQKNFFRHLIHTWKTVFRHKNFLIYLASDIETFAAVGIISFYANYAVEYCSVPLAFAAGLFVAFIYGGNLVVYLLFGWFNFFELKRKFLIGKICSFTAVLLLVLFKFLPVFFIVSFLLGAARGIRTLAFPPAVKRISNLDDATLYFSVAPILILPFSAGFPVLSGLILDKLQYLGGLSYRMLFAGYGVIMAFALFFLLKTRFPGVSGESMRIKRRRKN